MKNIIFDSEKKITYNWSGRFVPPGPEWIHMKRELTDYELIVVTEGTLYIADADTEYIVGPGEYLIMTPTSDQHGFKQGAVSFYWMHFSYDGGKNDHKESLSDEYVPGLLTIKKQSSLKNADRLIILLKQLMDSDKRYRESTLNGYLCGAVLSEIAAQGGAYRDYGLKIKGEQTFNDIKDYISWHISEPLKVRDVAEYFGYNEKYITTFFKDRAGVSIKQYILSEKFERAKVLLSETGTPVSEIAYSLGFQDAHNFSNAFKHLTGMSPGKWRETLNMHNIFNK